MKFWKKLAIGYGLIIFSVLLQAQEKMISNRIGVEFGFNDFFGETIVPERVRGGESIEGGDWLTNTYTNQILEVLYCGIKYEQYFYEKHIGFAAGLRFSQLSADINGGYTYFLLFPIENSFLWQFREEGIYTDYLRINRITQKNNYLGIPLEFSYITKKRDSFFRPYVKIGVVVNYLLSTTNSIVFVSEQMNNQYADAVENQQEKPKSFNSYFYPAIGFKLGKNRHIWINIEFQLSQFFNARKAHPFIRSNFGIGMQLSVQIPLNKKTK